MIDQTRRPDVPEPGWYATKLIKGGPEVACRIVCAQGLWVVIIGGEATSAIAFENPFDCPRMEWVMMSRRITQTEYFALLDAAAAARPGEPLADPTQPVSWRRAPSLY